MRLSMPSLSQDYVEKEITNQVTILTTGEFCILYDRVGD